MNLSRAKASMQVRYSISRVHRFSKACVSVGERSTPTYISDGTEKREIISPRGCRKNCSAAEAISKSPRRSPPRNSGPPPPPSFGSFYFCIFACTRELARDDKCASRGPNDRVKGKTKVAIAVCMLCQCSVSTTRECAGGGGWEREIPIKGYLLVNFVAGHSN